MTNTKPFHVYHLVDPTDKAVRYVGRCQDPKEARLFISILKPFTSE